MAKQRYIKWFAKLGLILVLIAGAPQVVSAILAETLYLPIVYKAKPTLTPTPTRTPTPTQPPIAIKNPSFEQGENGWDFDDEAYVTSAWAYNGHYSAALGDGTINHHAEIAQTITVPYNQYNLRYFQYTSTNEICSSVRYDYIIVQINGSGIQINNVCRDFNGISSWIINLVNYRGQTVEFRLEFISDDNIPSKAYVDDFAFIP